MIKSWMFEQLNISCDADPAYFDVVACSKEYAWRSELWAQLETLGFHGIFFSEHHFSGLRASPSPGYLQRGWRRAPRICVSGCSAGCCRCGSRGAFLRRWLSLINSVKGVLRSGWRVVPLWMRRLRSVLPRWTSCRCIVRHWIFSNRPG